MLSKICCLNEDLCNCKWMGMTRIKNVKFGYLILIMLVYLSLQLWNYLLNEDNVKLMESYGCQSGQQKTYLLDGFECVKSKNMFIVFIAVGVMHFVLMICMLLKSDKVKLINEGAWLLKVIAISITIILLRFIVTSPIINFFISFAYCLVFLLYFLETAVFMDLVYALDGKLNELSRQNRRVYFLKAVITIVVFIGTVYLCYISFRHDKSWISWANLSLLVIANLLTFLRFFPQNSLLVANLVCLCLIITSFNLAEPFTFEQNIWLIYFKSMSLIIILGGMLVEGSNILRTPKSSFNQIFALNTTDSQQNNRYVSSNKWTVYHLVMSVILLAIPAVLAIKDQSQMVKSWTEVSSVWWWGSLIFFYLWSLIGMKIYPEQDFSDLQNYFRDYQLK